MQFVFSTNNAYVPYLYVCLNSFRDCISKEDNFRINILYSDISQENKSVLKRLEDTNFHIHFKNVNEYVDVSDPLFHTNNHFSVETYFRFFLPEMFKDEEKIVYIDCDTLILKNPKELFGISLGDNYIGATRELEIVREIQTEGKKAKHYMTDVLGLKNPYDYIQAGCLVMNLKKMREDDIPSKLLQTLEKIKTPKYVDQDIFNIVCEGKITFLEQNWNYAWYLPLVDAEYEEHLGSPYNERYQKARQNPYIIHFAGREFKPESYPKQPEAQLFLKYALNSPFEVFFRQNLIKKEKEREKILLKKEKQLSKSRFLSRITFGKMREKYIKKTKKIEKRIENLKKL